MENLLMVQNATIREGIEKKLDDIVQYLLAIDYENKLPLGLFSGTTGVSLFLFHYSRHMKNEYIADRAMELLLYSVNEVDKDFYHSFCNGFSGICWCVNYLTINGFIDKDNLEIIELFDLYLGKQAFNDSLIGNYDYLHGACGTFVYLLKRLDNISVKYLEIEFVNCLYQSKKKVNNSCYWESKIGNMKNISISHGIASICIFLTKTYSSNLNKLKSKELAMESINFILNQENIFTKDLISKYPSFCRINSKNNSRLGWCYGDLGIAMAFWHYSQVFQDKVIEQKAIDIFLFNSKRRDLDLNAVIDASLCHGTSGIALIFYRMYINTHIELFLETAQYWLNQTLVMSKHIDGIVGYKSNNKDNSINLLTGVSGIGLALLTMLSGDNFDWDECLLLS